MIARAEQKESDVWGSESDEGDRATIGGDDGGEQTRGEEKEIACASDVYAEVGGIVVAKKDGIEGLRQQ